MINIHFLATFTQSVTVNNCVVYKAETDSLLITLSSMKRFDGKLNCLSL